MGGLGAVDRDAVGQHGAAQPAGSHQVVERLLDVVEGVAVALTPYPPAADALGRVGRPRMLADIALDDLRDHHRSLVAGPTHEEHPRRTISASGACAVPLRETLESGDFRPDAGRAMRR